MRQPDGEEEVEAKLRGKGGSGTTTEATRQPAGKHEANGRGGVQEANRRGGVSGQEATELQEDERRWRRDVRRRDNQPFSSSSSPPTGMAALLARSL